VEVHNRHRRLRLRRWSLQRPARSKIFPSPNTPTGTCCRPLRGILVGNKIRTTMALPSGTRLVHYETIRPLGAGGMGEVYRATDTKLKREVALKILPAQFAEDPSRLARFEREAQVLASLNHPNIAAIYGLEHANGIRFLVLELVEGLTLAERIASGPISITEALGIATKIAEAVESAHEKGIIHRDLKPANVKLTPDGKVKVLDFGLAKALGEPDPPDDLANSPTMTMQETRAGIVLGTAAYMSPEQASGKQVDKRTDIWSFGVLLYEMLTGRRAFEGKTVSHIIVHVMEQEPDWTKLPPLPAGVQDLVEGCLQKDPAQRRRDIGDVRIQLQTAITKPVHPQHAADAKKGRKWLWPAAAMFAVAGAGAGFIYLRPKPAAPEAVQFEIGQPEQASLTSALSISPDGRKLAFIATGADQRVLIWVRSMATLEARPLDATLGVDGYPFWSADSRWIVFRAQDKLKKIEATGGPAQVLCDVASNLDGGFWTPDNRIVFAVFSGGILQVPAAGGAPSPVTLLPERRGQHYFPALLPDGRHFLYTANRGTGAPGVYLGSLDAKPDQQATKRLLADTVPVVYASSPDPNLGYILFSRFGQNNSSGTLMAQPFDPKKLELVGEAVPIAENVDDVGFSASSTGVLVYRTGPAFVSSQGENGTAGQLTWFDRQGKVLGTAGNPSYYLFTINLSPDGTRVAAAHSAQNVDIWVFEFARGVDTRFTFDPGADMSPVWSPDGTKIMFSRGGPANNTFFIKAANGAGSEELLFTPEQRDVAITPGSWSRDGRFLVYSVGGGKGDIWVLSMGNTPSERKAVPLLKTEFNERGPRFSPDGHWFSYTSNATGKDEAYVRSFDPATISSNGGEFQVSVGGGQSPHWRGDGKEIFYQAPDGTMMSVEVSTTPVFKAGSPKALFKGPRGVRFWDVTADGQKFLMPVPQDANSPASYKVVLNWTSTLKK